MFFKFSSLKHFLYHCIIWFITKVRIYVILGEWSMHLALIEAMYKMKLIGKSQTGSQNVKIGNQMIQDNDEPKYFVVGVEKDEWDIKGSNC